MSKLIEIKNKFLSVSINTLGAEFSNIKGADGTEFLWCGDKTVWGGKAPILFPICGGLKGGKYLLDGKEYQISKHGFARNSEFKAEILSESSAKFTLKSTEDTLSVFPFEFVLTVTYELVENSIKITYTVENKSTEKMYFSIGSHEAYSCPEGIEEYYVEFKEPLTLDAYPVVGTDILDEPVRIGENIKTLPLKYEYFEVDALIFKDVDFSEAALVHKNGKKCSVSFPGFNNFLIWTKPGAKYLCLEPWCGSLEMVSSPAELDKKHSIINLDSGCDFNISHIVTFEN